MKIFKKSSFMRKYAQWIHQLKTDKSHFVPITDTPFVRHENDPKIFAYYLTQFHAIPENDDAHGRGFTEWTNVAGAVPCFVGHVQPHIPYDVGFYNLNDINVMRRQVELAKMYGVYGFCFYYYWFSGRRVLEKPLEMFLNSDIDFPFHFLWANENWSKLWDGGNKEVILEQKLADDDADKFFADILPYIKDSRYEKIDNKPILSIYNMNIFPADKLSKFTERLDELARENGFDGFWFMANPVGGFNEPQKFGFRGIIEFPPHVLFNCCAKLETERLRDGNNFAIGDMTEYIQSGKYLTPHDYTVFKACFPSWDNSPRKAYSYGWVFKMTSADFRDWLTGIIKWTRKNNAQNQQYVYINAWNEWGEGAHLEPDTYYGYQKLSIVKEVLEGVRNED